MEDVLKKTLLKKTSKKGRRPQKNWNGGQPQKNNERRPKKKMEDDLTYNFKKQP